LPDLKVVIYSLTTAPEEMAGTRFLYLFYVFILTFLTCCLATREREDEHHFVILVYGKPCFKKVACLGLEPREKRCDTFLKQFLKLLLPERKGGEKMLRMVEVQMTRDGASNAKRRTNPGHLTAGGFFPDNKVA